MKKIAMFIINWIASMLVVYTLLFLTVLIHDICISNSPKMLIDAIINFVNG